MTFADTSNLVRACLHVLLFESTWSPKLRRMSYTSIFSVNFREKHRFLMKIQ